MVTCHDKQFEQFITHEQIHQRLAEIGQAINKAYTGKQPLFLGILNGVFKTAADLIRYVELDCEVSFVKLKSYDGLQSSGQLTTMLGLDQDIKGRHVIVMEDIVDTGRTMHQFLPQLHELGAASVALVTLLHKPAATQFELPLDYVGFEVPDAFLIGYGLDYDGLGRHYNDIYKLVEE